MTMYNTITIKVSIQVTSKSDLEHVAILAKALELDVNIPNMHADHITQSADTLYDKLDTQARFSNRMNQHESYQPKNFPQAFKPVDHVQVTGDTYTFQFGGTAKHADPHTIMRFIDTHLNGVRFKNVQYVCIPNIIDCTDVNIAWEDLSYNVFV